MISRSPSAVAVSAAWIVASLAASVSSSGIEPSSVVARPPGVNSLFWREKALVTKDAPRAYSENGGYQALRVDSSQR